MWGASDDDDDGDAAAWVDAKFGTLNGQLQNFPPHWQKEITVATQFLAVSHVKSLQPLLWSSFLQLLSVVSVLLRTTLKSTGLEVHFL